MANPNQPNPGFTPPSFGGQNPTDFSSAPKATQAPSPSGTSSPTNPGFTPPSIGGVGTPGTLSAGDFSKNSKTSMTDPTAMGAGMTTMGSPENQAAVSQSNKNLTGSLSGMTQGAGGLAYTTLTSRSNPVMAGVDDVAKGWTDAQDKDANQQYHFDQMSTPSGVIATKQVNPIQTPKTE
jgi:hypothetical protein